MAKKHIDRLVAEARSDYLLKGGSLTTWNGDYAKIYKRLPQNEPLTEELITALITATTPNTRTRQRACMALRVLAQSAGLIIDTSSYAGNYAAQSKQPNFEVELPTDDQILMFGLGIKNKAWRRIYGLIATYGLRPHEAFFVDDSRIGSADPQLRVLEGKTGPRICYPFPRDWVRRFALHQHQPLPKVGLCRPHEAIGHSATSYFWGLKTPHNLYAMRHAHALRMKSEGVPDQWAAAWQGHSQEVHRSIYLKFLGPDGGAATYAQLQPPRATRINDRHARKSQ